jgi:hypothetical protein
MKQVRDKQYSVALPDYIIKKVEKDAKKLEMKRATMLNRIILDRYENK